MDNQKKLTRSRDDRMIAGVCGGLGKYFDIDSTVVRLIFIVAILIDGLGILIYIAMAIIVPEEKTNVRKYQPEKEGLPESDDERTEGGQENTEQEYEKAETPEEHRKQDHENAGKDSQRDEGPAWIGIGLILIGVFLILDRIDIFWWLSWNILWPLLIVFIGIWILVRRGG
ncbi:phage shock protein C, PspC [Methanosalsum zhilinae DSM 4017]|uniref:Phage shock protein C, PspC n=1 Tax=Methanosalsum zhilinae (strain DSM 4017 / NBRC 107636 / OCM 62 / WeN5) TaxID=679901 RepID=F7XN75_METZD|nr:PspC domain-containing protein [Methanosalsum zhilinae]AEH60032.1 phage shock protein C, PspC [Methanosalsum zhilinae DSM 4017]